MAGLRLEHGCSRNSVCVLNYYGILISKGNLGIPFPSTKPSKIPNLLRDYIRFSIHLCLYRMAFFKISVNSFLFTCKSIIQLTMKPKPDFWHR